MKRIIAMVMVLCLLPIWGFAQTIPNETQETDPNNETEKENYKIFYDLLANSDDEQIISYYKYLARVIGQKKEKEFDESGNLNVGNMLGYDFEAVIRRETEEQKVARYIIFASKQFKSPQLVRLFSGEFVEREKDGYSETLLCVKLSAPNGYGTPIVDDYIIDILLNIPLKVYDRENNSKEFLGLSSHFDALTLDYGKINTIIADYWQDRGL